MLYVYLSKYSNSIFLIENIQNGNFERSEWGYNYNDDTTEIAESFMSRIFKINFDTNFPNVQQINASQNNITQNDKKLIRKMGTDLFNAVLLCVTRA